MTPKMKEALDCAVFAVFFFGMIFGLPWLFYAVTGHYLDFGGPTP